MLDTSDYNGDELPPSEDFNPERNESKAVVTERVADELAGQAGPSVWRHRHGC